MFSLKFGEFLKGYIREELESLVAQLKAFMSVEHNDDGTHNIAFPSGVIEVGTIIMWAAPIIPRGYVKCDGRALDRVVYKTLFARWGTTHGIGDGVTTFNVLNAKGRFLLGVADAGTGSVLGSTGGAIDHTHSVPAHTHTFSGTTDPELVTIPVDDGNVVAQHTVPDSPHDHAFAGTTDASAPDSSGIANPPFVAVFFLVFTGVYDA